MPSPRSFISPWLSRPVQSIYSNPPPCKSWGCLPSHSIFPRQWRRVSHQINCSPLPSSLTVGQARWHQASSGNIPGARWGNSSWLRLQLTLVWMSSSQQSRSSEILLSKISPWVETILALLVTMKRTLNQQKKAKLEIRKMKWIHKQKTRRSPEKFWT